MHGLVFDRDNFFTEKWIYLFIYFILNALLALMTDGIGIKQFYYCILRTFSTNIFKIFNKYFLSQGEFGDRFVSRYSPETVCSCSYQTFLKGNDLRKEEMQTFLLGAQWRRLKNSDKRKFPYKGICKQSLSRESCPRTQGNRSRQSQ